MAMYPPIDPDERKRQLLARLAGMSGKRSGDFEGRGLARSWRGGPALNLAALLGNMGQRRFDVGMGGMGGRWDVMPPSPGDFPTLPPPANPPSDGWEGYIPPPQPQPPTFIPPPPWFRPPPGGPFRPI